MNGEAAFIFCMAILIFLVMGDPDLFDFLHHWAQQASGWMPSMEDTQ